jgi:hypothetical protein
VSCFRSIGPTANPEGSFSPSVCNRRARRSDPSEHDKSKVVLLSCRFARRACEIVGAHGVLRLLCAAFRIVAAPLEWVLSDEVGSAVEVVGGRRRGFA